MRIAFVEDTLRFSIPLGITTVASMLRSGGHHVAVFVVESDLEGTLDRIAAFQPDAAAFSVLSGSHQAYFEIARQIKQRMDVPTIWGGPHTTFFPEIIDLDCVDAVCRGEGEEAALAFADAWDAQGGKLPTEVPNFWIKREGEIHQNPLRPRNRTLDEFPYPARDLYYDQFDILKSHGIKHFIAHRGCPYKCTYCFNHSYNEMYRSEAGDKKIFHSRSPDSIVDEVLWLRERVPLKMVTFVDDVFTLHRKWTMDFCEIYGQRCGVPFSINARFDNIDPEMVEALAEAGLSLVYAGVEAGNEFIRNTVMKRSMTEESMAEAAELYKRHGVKLLTENVLGNPGETFDMALETLKINMAIRPDVANASIFTPYPKLEMTRYAIENGFFDGDFDRLESNYYHRSILTFPNDTDLNGILNLRSFFSLLTRNPWLLSFLLPALRMKHNAFFRWIGDLADGFYLKRCMAYKMSVREFFSTLRHYLTNYRGHSATSRSAMAKQTSVPEGSHQPLEAPRALVPSADRELPLGSRPSAAARPDSR